MRPRKVNCLESGYRYVHQQGDVPGKLPILLAPLDKHG
jgi:hypothetical protein